MFLCCGLQAVRWKQHAAATTPSPEVRLNLAEKMPVLLREAFEWYPQLMLQKRAEVAQEHGVETKIGVMDGNMKLAGRICARPHAEVEYSPGLKMWLAHCCGQEPAHKKRRCAQHAESRPPVDPWPRQAEEVVAHRRSRRVCDGEAYEVLLKAPEVPAWQGRWVVASQATPTQLHEYWKKMDQEGASVPVQSSASDLQASSCKTHKEHGPWLKKLIRAGRSNGFLFMVTPEGYCLHTKPFFGSESISQRHVFLGEASAAFAELETVVHDDACHLRKYSWKHRGRSELAARLAYPRTKYVLDRWHEGGHVDEWCRLNCKSDTEENKAILAGVNTSRAESWNSLMLRHKWLLRAMSRYTRAFFVHEVVDIRNAAMVAQKRAKDAA